MYSSPPMYRRKNLRDPGSSTTKVFAFAMRKWEDAVVNHLNARLQPRHPIDRPTLLADDDMRVGQRAAVEQVRCDHGVAALKGFPVGVLIREQTSVFVARGRPRPAR